MSVWFKSPGGRQATAARAPAREGPAPFPAVSYVSLACELEAQSYVNPDLLSGDGYRHPK